MFKSKTLTCKIPLNSAQTLPKQEGSEPRVLLRGIYRLRLLMAQLRSAFTLLGCCTQTQIRVHKPAGPFLKTMGSPFKEAVLGQMEGEEL